MKRLGPFRLRRDVVQRFYDIHSWTGILGGLALFICAFSGTIALFERELLAWEQPAIRIEPGTSPLGVDDLIASAKDRLGPTQDLFVGLPDGSHGVLQARVFSHGEVDEIFIDPYSGAIVDAADETAFAFLTHLHTDLHLPRPFGRYLVGLLGVLMMASLIAGALAHPRILKDLFLLRWRPSLRLSASDVHKQVGVWGLAFGTVMAFTGAVIGLLGLIAPIMVLSAFGGDVGKATEAFSGPAFEETGVETTMLPLGPLIDQLEEQRPGFAVTSFFIRHWGDETAEAAFNLERDPYRQLTAGETHRLSLVDGRTIHVTTFTDAGVGSRLFGAMQPVHYALFGGLGLKLLYFVSGLVLSLGIVTGTLLWFERRRAVGADGRGRYRRLARLHLGASIGLIL
ncbi:MAG: PepSY-associated TM helix domain-containing protein, partial [Acidobacteriota bacterium]